MGVIVPELEGRSSAPSGGSAEVILVVAKLNARQLTGVDASHLVRIAGGHRLQPVVAAAFMSLQADARAAGFELAVASSYRSFERQLAIWNGKASGRRKVHDDTGAEVNMANLPPAAQLHAILRYSAIPGSSRHHWGTDLDVFDAAAVAPDYTLQLSPAEVQPGGVFDPLHRWLDQRMALGKSHGFYRPYAKDSGGVAPERWHLSFAPLALACADQLTASVLATCWDCDEAGETLLLRAEIEADWPGIFSRYVKVSEGWCPRPDPVGATAATR